jgi:hypothetical protein
LVEGWWREMCLNDDIWVLGISALRASLEAGGDVECELDGRMSADRDDMRDLRSQGVACEAVGSRG